METKLTLSALPPAKQGPATPPVVAQGAARAKPEVQSPAQANPREEATPQQLQRTVEELQRKVQISSPNLQFSIDRDTGKTVIKVIDSNTKELIRQIPPDEILQLAKEIDRMRGLLLHRQG